MATIDSSLVLNQKVNTDGFAPAVADYCRRMAQQARDARGGSPEWFVGTGVENLAGHIGGLTIFDQQLRALQALSIAGGTSANAYEPALGSMQAKFVALLTTERTPAPVDELVSELLAAAASDVAQASVLQVAEALAKANAADQETARAAKRVLALESVEQDNEKLRARVGRLEGELQQVRGQRDYFHSLAGDHTEPKPKRARATA